MSSGDSSARSVPLLPKFDPKFRAGGPEWAGHVGARTGQQVLDIVAHVVRGGFMRLMHLLPLPGWTKRGDTSDGGEWYCRELHKEWSDLGGGDAGRHGLPEWNDAGVSL